MYAYMNTLISFACSYVLTILYSEVVAMQSRIRLETVSVRALGVCPRPRNHDSATIQTRYNALLSLGSNGTKKLAIATVARWTTLRQH